MVSTFSLCPCLAGAVFVMLVLKTQLGGFLWVLGVRWLPELSIYSVFFSLPEILYFCFQVEL
jgi:hypothetical protein